MRLARPPVRLSVRPSPAALLALFGPVVWWGAFAPPLLWVLPVLGGLLWYGRRSPRAFDVAVFGAAAVALAVAIGSGQSWFPALGIFVKLMVGFGLVAGALHFVSGLRPTGGAWGLGLLGALWLLAPSGVGLFALLTCALLVGEVRHRFRQHRDLITPRGLAPLALAFGALALVGGALSLLRVRDPLYRDPGGERSPFLGFNFSWADNSGSAPAWAQIFEVLGYVLLGVCLLAALVALGWSLWGFARTTLEEWDLHWLKVRPEPEAVRAATGPSLEGVRFLYEGFLRLAAAKGFTRKDHETPHEFEARVLTRLPHWAPDIDVLSRAYHPVRYGELPSGPLFDEARSALDRLHRDVTGAGP